MPYVKCQNCNGDGLIDLPGGGSQGCGECLWGDAWEESDPYEEAEAQLKDGEP